MKRTLTCSICGRTGAPRKFWHQRGTPPVCRDEDICYRGYQFRAALAAMPTPEEERERVKTEVAARLAEIKREAKR